MNLRQAGVCFWYTLQSVRTHWKAQRMSPRMLVWVSTSPQILVAFLQSERSGPDRKHLGTTQFFAAAPFTRNTTRKRLGQYILQVYISPCLLLAHCRGEKTGRASSAFRPASVALRDMNQLRKLPYNIEHGLGEFFFFHRKHYALLSSTSTPGWLGQAGPSSTSSDPEPPNRPRKWNRILVSL